MAKNLALLAFSITLGLLFVTIGLIKLTPAVNADMHKEMVSLSIYLSIRLKLERNEYFVYLTNLLFSYFLLQIHNIIIPLILNATFIF